MGAWGCFKEASCVMRIPKMKSVYFATAAVKLPQFNLHYFDSGDIFLRRYFFANQLCQLILQSSLTVYVLNIHRCWWTWAITCPGWLVSSTNKAITIATITKLNLEGALCPAKESSTYASTWLEQTFIIITICRAIVPYRLSVVMFTLGAWNDWFATSTTTKNTVTGEVQCAVQRLLASFHSVAAFT